jgi:hypothetical protein
VDKQTVLDATEAMRGLFPATPLQLNEHLSARYGADIYPLNLRIDTVEPSVSNATSHHDDG